MLSFVIVSIPELNLAKVAETLNNLFLVFPNYAVGIGIVQLSTIYQIQQQCQSFASAYFCATLPNHFCCIQGLKLQNSPRSLFTTESCNFEFF